MTGSAPQRWTCMENYRVLCQEFGIFVEAGVRGPGGEGLCHIDAPGELGGFGFSLGELSPNRSKNEPPKQPD